MYWKKVSNPVSVSVKENMDGHGRQEVESRMSAPHKDFCTCAVSGRKAGSCFNLPVPEQVLVWHQSRTDTIEKNYLLMGYDCSQKKKYTQSTS